jgi:hypothetical protein
VGLIETADTPSGPMSSATTSMLGGKPEPDTRTLAPGCATGEESVSVGPAAAGRAGAVVGPSATSRSAATRVARPMHTTVSVPKGHRQVGPSREGSAAVRTESKRARDLHELIAGGSAPLCDQLVVGISAAVFMGSDLVGSLSPRPDAVPYAGPPLDLYFRSVNRRQILAQIEGQDEGELLLHIFHQPDHEASAVSLASAVGDREYAQTLSRTLVTLGLAEPERSLAGEVGLTPLGRVVAAALDQDNATGAGRIRSVRQFVLTAAAESDESLSADHVAAGWPDSLRPISVAEVSDAMEWLITNRLVAGVTTFGGTYIHGTTVRGREALARQLTLIDSAPDSGYRVDQSTTLNNFGPVSAQQVGDGNIQYITSPLSPEVVDEIRQLLLTARDLADHFPERAERLVPPIDKAIEEAKSPSPSRGRLRDAAQAGITAAAAAAGTASGGQLVHALGQVVDKL